MNLMHTKVHHDGSPLYVSNSCPVIGDNVRLKIRVSNSNAPAKIFVRSVADGEPVIVEARQSQVVGQETWWIADLTIRNRVTNYRWLLSGGDWNYSWLNAAGLFNYDVPDSLDFVISAGAAPPYWVMQEPVYQIFPDRFARDSSSDQLGVVEGTDIPGWAIPRAWTDHPEGRGPNTPFELFGGTLSGVVEKLEHIRNLGFGVLYSTPVFPAGSTHRYDASTFQSIDPLLGGNAAMDQLINALHGLGMYFLGDITLNHCGRNHEWFVLAQDSNAPERKYFYFGPEFEAGYECWLGVPSLPKLNYLNPETVAAMINGSTAPIRQWLEGPSGWDGWRVDVANMSGRHKAVDITHEIARVTRETMLEVAPNSVLLAEHGHDASADLDGDGWHGTMNYAGFTRQVWSWLRAPEFHEDFYGIPIEVPSISGVDAVDSIKLFHGRIPWRALLSSWNILGSHDTARIRTVVGTRERQEAALALAIGLPGVPMVFAGDEIGAQGYWGEDSRTPFPWQDKDQWDLATLETYRDLISLRGQSKELAEGGLRWVMATPDVIAFIRDGLESSFLFVISRDPALGISLDLNEYGLSEPEHVFGFTAQVDEGSLTITIPRAGAGIWRLKGNVKHHG